MLAQGVSDPYCRFIEPGDFANMKKYDVTGVGLNLGTAEEYIKKTVRAQHVLWLCYWGGLAGDWEPAPQGGGLVGWVGRGDVKAGVCCIVACKGFTLGIGKLTP